MLDGPGSKTAFRVRRIAELSKLATPASRRNNHAGRERPEAPRLRIQAAHSAAAPVATTKTARTSEDRTVIVWYWLCAMKNSSPDATKLTSHLRTPMLNCRIPNHYNPKSMSSVRDNHLGRRWPHPALIRNQNLIW